MPDAKQEKNLEGLGAIMVIALLAAAPIAAVIAGAAGAGENLLFGARGFHYLSTTLFLCLFAGAGAGALGAGAAMLISLAEFPGRKLFAIALALPFAIPAYVAAYAYGDLFGPFGAVAAVTGPEALPEIRSLPGAAFVLMLTTYPYVYLAMTASLSARSASLMEAARALGASPLRASFDILLTASRPAFFGGLALALMEIAADYGVADYFGVRTLSVGIFRTWHGLGDLTGAMQLAAGLFFVALLLVLMESASRKGRASEDVRAARESRPLKLSGPHAIGAMTLCALPVIFGFVAPAGVLIAKLDFGAGTFAPRHLGEAARHTAFIAAAGAFLAAALSLMLAYGARAARGRIAKLALRAATLGYAVPGAVMSIGILALSAGFARVTGHAVAGGVLVLLYAYVARFLTAGYNATAGGMAQISPQLDAAAKMLGAAPARLVREVHWPMARGSILAGAAIVAIDIAKELPATLILRPFNFETLSTQIYRLASDERLADAAPAALILIGLGLAPSLILSLIADRSAQKTRKRETLAGPEPELESFSTS
ncbi:ABC transporter permease [Hyphococcus luteus]|uniref:Iron ABC transporter permease n=1 Tax=Hyphococcus luteus TaxID=2058213 RepID=A0A2S7K5P1_9PROT|nr:iron ABC transporter permease [Marinicaulis flavus]PQA87768.1 iron ABC transporter permease [Marinicaulis flavus]